MAIKLSNTGIVAGQVVKSAEVSQSIDAFLGTIDAIPDHEELYEDLRDHWYDAQDDVIDEELSSFMNAMPDKVSA